jgi:pyruvate dehydrogenase E2 component (dihydrolipoamide acetyltransferase)
MIEFKLPYLGADTEEGTLLEWRIKPGDVVKKGTIVAVVDTAKAAVDIESWDEGTVFELVAQPEEILPVGTTMALLLEPGESREQAEQWKAAHPISAVRAAAPQPAIVAGAAGQEMPSAPPAPDLISPASQRRVSPAARKRADELGMRLEGVVGTGPDGAVTIADVEQAARAGAPPAVTPTVEPAQPARNAAADKASEMRRIIAAAMARSKREIPHYYLAEDVPLERATQWLAAANQTRPIHERLLLAPLFIKAAALALKKFPELNGFWREGEFAAGKGIHIGVAISLRQGGLIAPAIHDADRKDLDTLMRDLADLVKRTRAGSLKSSEMADPTITITNLGDEGVDSVFGVIYPPQVALVGFGRIRQRPWVSEGQVQIASVVTASLSADHRVSDGHRGGLFLAAVRQLLQTPHKLVEENGSD